MSRLTSSQAQTRLDISGVFLCMLASWTIAIKFINPLCFAWAEYQRTGNAHTPYIMWDFWWVPHILLAVWLWQRRLYAWEFGIVVSIVEIFIIVTKFIFYLRDPMALRFAHVPSPPPPLLDTFFTNTWFINKIFVLAFFIFLLIQLLRPEFKNFLRPHPNPSE
jgi:hypothetical protein